MNKICIIPGFLFFLFQLVYPHPALQAQNFETLGGGLRITGEIRAMEFDTLNNRTFVGGNFTQINNVQSQNIAWEDSTGWHSFGTGTQGSIRALEFADGKLYAGGYFNSIDGQVVENIAFWDGTTWNQLGSGISGGVYSIAYYDSALYVSGTISQAGGIMVNGIAKWDGTAWSSVGAGADAQGVFMKVLDDTLYAYGSFLNFNGMPAEKIISYDGTNWVAHSVNDTDAIVFNITKFKNTLCASIYNTADHWQELRLENNGSWSNLITGLESYNYYPLTAVEDTLYFFGRGNSGIHDTLYIHKINKFGNIFHTSKITEDQTGLRLSWYCAELLNNSIYVGGCFHNVDSLFAGGCIKIEGTSMSAPYIASTGYVDSWYYGIGFSLYNDTTQNLLYAGGKFEYAGDSLAANIAVWNGASWSPLGIGFQDPDKSIIVRKIAKYNNKIYAVGSFKNSGNTTVNNIASWNGTVWDSVGSGSDALIRDMVEFNNELYVCGIFSTYNGIYNTRGFVKYDGTNWYKVTGINFNDPNVYSMCIYNNQLLISGDFAFGKIARYNGVSWTAFPGYPGSEPLRLANLNGVLYASDADTVYKYDTAWSVVHGPTSNFASGYHPSRIGNHVIIGDNDANRTFGVNPDGEVVPFCYNILYNAEQIDSTSAYVAGFLPRINLNGHVINNIAKVHVELPVAQFDYSDDSICDHQYVYFTVPVTDYIQQFQWSFPGGIPGVSTAFSPAIKYSVPGDYDVVLKTSNIFGSDSVTFFNLIHVENCTLGDDENENWFGIFPNPVRDIISVRWTSEIQNFTADVLDITGRNVGISKHNEENSGSLELDCSTLSPGIYLIEMKSGSRSYFKKFVKQ